MFPDLHRFVSLMNFLLISLQAKTDKVRKTEDLLKNPEVKCSYQITDPYKNSGRPNSNRETKEILKTISVKNTFNATKRQALYTEDLIF